MPSDTLTTHLDLLEGLAGSVRDAEGDDRCRATLSRSYRLQIGYPDGQVAQVSGSTDPGCVGTILASGSSVGGPPALGVYAVVMAAYGRQYSDGFEPAASDTPLACPLDPREPDSVDVDVDGSSADLETGYHLGRLAPMMLPLTAVRGIVCTWQRDGGGSARRPLSAADAERLRIRMHAISRGMVDCAQSSDPTHAAVVEDKTGTRRAVTVIESECSTVVRSDGGYGLGFPWLERHVS